MTNQAGLFLLAFSAGTATFFAPCAFPLLPGYISYFVGDSAATAADTPDGNATTVTLRAWQAVVRSVLITVVAGLGMATVYLGLTGITITVGAELLGDIAVLEVVVGVLFVAAGGAMAAGWKLHRLPISLPERKRSISGYFSFGFLYAAAAAGCTAPLFIAVLTRGFVASPATGFGIAVAYTLGMWTLLFSVTALSAFGGSSASGVLSQHTQSIYRIAGVLLAGSGLVEIHYYFYGLPEVVPR